MIFSNTVYDRLKWTAQYALPGLGTLYFALASIWGLPYGEQIIGTITAVDVFLGVLLGVSTNAYVKQEPQTMSGRIVVDLENPEKDFYTLEIDESLEELSNAKRVMFDVVKPDSQ